VQKIAFFTQENRSGSHIVFCAKKRVKKRAEKSRKKDVKNQAKIPHCFSQKHAEKSPHFYLGKTYDFFDFTAMFLPLVFTALST
jgi:hypothetical protein